MHPRFSEWYRKASIDADNDLLVARWKGIESFTAKIDVPKLIELVRCFVRLPWKNIAIQKEFVAEFQAADAAFPISDNDIELQVLAGASVIALLMKSSKISDVAASVLDAAAAPGLRKAPVVPEILTITEKYVFDRANAIRSTSAWTPVNGVKHVQLIEAVKTACATNSAIQVAEPLDKILRALNETINKVAEAAEASLTAVRTAAMVQAEESNMVWWVFGETSRDVQKRFSELPVGFAVALAGKELADLTNVVPGVRAGRAYLDKVLGSSSTKKVTLSDVAKDSPKEWTTQLGYDEKILDLCPILYVLHQTSQLQEPRTAVESARKLLGISGSTILPVDAAVQTYRECVAVKSLR
jgi:hypothetical protein